MTESPLKNQLFATNNSKTFSFRCYKITSFFIQNKLVSVNFTLHSTQFDFFLIDDLCQEFELISTIL